MGVLVGSLGGYGGRGCGPPPTEACEWAELARVAFFLDGLWPERRFHSSPLSGERSERGGGGGPGFANWTLWREAAASGGVEAGFFEVALPKPGLFTPVSAYVVRTRLLLPFPCPSDLQELGEDEYRGLLWEAAGRG